MIALKPPIIKKKWLIQKNIFYPKIIKKYFYDQVFSPNIEITQNDFKVSPLLFFKLLSKATEITRLIARINEFGSDFSMVKTLLKTLSNLRISVKNMVKPRKNKCTCS